MTDTVRVQAKGQITIPAEFRKKLGIDTDTLLDVTLTEGKLEITPIKIQDNEILREYTDKDIQRFLQEDKIDSQTAKKVRALLAQEKT